MCSIYPDKALQIALSQGHTTTTQYEHYLNIPFDDEDRKEMRKWVEGVDMSKIQNITLKDGSRVENTFSYYMDTCNPRRPSTLEAKVDDHSGNYKWAFLQVYREIIKSSLNELTVDPDPYDEKKPPYYCSHDGPFAGSWRAANFSDSPCYNFKDVGKISFYTTFSEILETNADPRKQRYALKGGVAWGIEMDQDGKMKSTPMRLMNVGEYQATLTALEKEYKEARFEQNLLI